MGRHKKPRIHYLPDYFANPYDPIKIHLVGAGGTGSHVATCLARLNHSLRNRHHLGFDVCIIDPDIVEESNVGRQGFYSNEVGFSKSRMLVGRINRSFGTEWDCLQEDYNIHNLRRPNIIISCVDKASVRYDIENELKHYRGRYSERDNVYYWMDFGNTTTTGQVIMGTVSEYIEQPKSLQYMTVKKFPNIIQLFPNLRDMEKSEQQGESCSLIGHEQTQDLFVNSVLAELGIKMLWEFFRNLYLDYSGFFYNGDTLEIKKLILK